MSPRSGPWGAGSRGVQFLNLADPQRRLAAVVDVNPRKWGRYLPVTAHRVDAPETLSALRALESGVQELRAALENDDWQTIRDLWLRAAAWRAAAEPSAEAEVVTG